MEHTRPPVFILKHMARPGVFQAPYLLFLFFLDSNQKVWKSAAAVNQPALKPARPFHTCVLICDQLRTHQFFSKWENTWILMYRRFILNWRRVMYTRSWPCTVHTPSAQHTYITRLDSQTFRLYFLPVCSRTLINASTIVSALCDISYILAGTNDGVLAVSLFLLPVLF